jgi:uncharacterized membrane protein
VNRVLATIKNHFLSGVLVVVPLILTYIVLRFLFETIDSILQPLLLHLLGYYIPGLGVITTVLIILLAGILTRNFIGAKLHALGESVLVRVPLIRPVYSAAKQVLEAITRPNMEAFKEVVLVEYPRRGSFQIGFLSSRLKLTAEDESRQYVSVFVPSTPTPVSGNVVIVPVSDVRRIDLSVEDGVKFLVSAGVTAPDKINFRPTGTALNKSEVFGEAG